METSTIIGLSFLFVVGVVVLILGLTGVFSTEKKASTTTTTPTTTTDPNKQAIMQTLSEVELKLNELQRKIS